MLFRCLSPVSWLNDEIHAIRQTLQILHTVAKSKQQDKRLARLRWGGHGGEG